MVLWRPTRPSRTNTKKKKKCLFHHRGLECKSRKSKDTWNNRQVWPWSTKWSRAKANRVLPRECTGHSKHPLPQHKRWLYTWSSPDGQYWNQIDYILCSWDPIASIRWIIEKAREFPKNIYFCFIDYTKVFDCVDHHKLRKILKEIEIPDHLTWLLRNLYAGQEATVRTGHGKTDWFQIRKGVRQGCILSPSLFNLYAEHIVRNAGLDESRLLGEISVTLDMQMTPPFRWHHPYGRKWRRNKEPLDQSERRVEKLA